MSTKLDETARKFLGTDAPTVTQGQKVSDDAKTKRADYVAQEFTNRAGRLTEKLHDALMKLRKDLGLTDEETVGGVALLTINLRDSYGVQAGEKVDAKEVRARLAQFDQICEAMQAYYDRETGK